MQPDKKSIIEIPLTESELKIIKQIADKHNLKIEDYVLQKALRAATQRNY